MRGAVRPAPPPCLCVHTASPPLCAHTLLLLFVPVTAGRVTKRVLYKFKQVRGLNRKETRSQTSLRFPAEQHVYGHFLRSWGRSEPCRAVSEEKLPPPSEVGKGQQPPGPLPQAGTLQRLREGPSRSTHHCRSAKWWHLCGTVGHHGVCLSECAPGKLVKNGNLAMAHPVLSPTGRGHAGKRARARGHNVGSPTTRGCRASCQQG